MRRAQSSRDVEIPAEMIGLAERRTEFLFRHMQYGPNPMKMILASAYIQGMNDMFDALENAGLIGPTVSRPHGGTHD
jgi:hypothetical protein